MCRTWKRHGARPYACWNGTMVCGDPMAVHIMNIMNRCMYGREQIMIREDMLCALWMRGKREYIQHWLIRPLYERYGQEGWQSILPEISAGLTEDDEEEDIVTLRGESELCCLQKAYDRASGEL